MWLSNTGFVALGLLLPIALTSAAVADSAPSLELAEGWYEGYDTRFLDYKGLQINEDGNHLLLTAHLSWGMVSFRNIYFEDEHIQCSNVECVIDVPELDHGGHRNRLVLSPAPTGAWYVMQTSAKPEGELVITVSYELKENNQGSDGYMFTTRYEEQLQNIEAADDFALDGLWIGVQTSEMDTKLIALEYESGEPVTLVNFFEGNSSEMEFPVDGIRMSEHAFSLTAQRGSSEHRITLANQNNLQLLGYVVREFPNGMVHRNSVKLIRVRPVR